MTIMPADRGDAAEILALQKLAYLSEAAIYQDHAIPPLTQTLEELVESFSRNTVLKAVEDGKIVGSVNGRLSKGRCLIGRLMVHPQGQGRGLGSALMLAIERAFPDATSFRLFTGARSESNIRLYRKLGYEILDSKEVPGSFAVVFMEKPGAAAS